ncbi:TRAM domain-containing protein, partial [Vibrio sp. D173a]|uniref:TRAM domain-containing protein n=1 Tax=Vibrio sp. D173a TaxID=2836349 RepID=UPI0025527F9C
AGYEDTPELVSFLHLPVQSGSDRILTMMKRPHTAIEYKSIIRKLRKARPDIQISSDFIVGFPGEDVDFDMSFSFIFSPRPGTPAADYPCDVPEQEKKERLYELQQVVNSQAMRYSRLMLDTEQRVLVEGPSKKNLMELRARTENNRVVNFEGSADLIGQFVDVKITDVFANSLRGELVRTEKDMDLRTIISPTQMLAN